MVGGGRGVQLRTDGVECGGGVLLVRDAAEGGVSGADNWAGALDR